MLVPSSDESQRPHAAVLLARGLRLRCPYCGQGRLFRGLFTMHDECPVCGRVHNRAPGFFLGSIYFNYGITAFLVVVIYFTGYFAELATPRQLVLGLLLFSVLFPLWFFRYARGLWIAFDELFDPWRKDAAL